MIPLSQDLGRRFLYARYNADLSREGLDALGLHDIKPKNVQKLDSIEYIDDLRRGRPEGGRRDQARTFRQFYFVRR